MPFFTEWVTFRPQVRPHSTCQTSCQIIGSHIRFYFCFFLNPPNPAAMLPWWGGTFGIINNWFPLFSSIADVQVDLLRWILFHNCNWFLKFLFLWLTLVWFSCFWGLPMVLLNPPYSLGWSLFLIVSLSWSNLIFLYLPELVVFFSAL